MHLPQNQLHIPSSRRANMAWSGNEFEESLAITCSHTTSHNLLLQTYMCAAELVIWGVGPNLNKIIQNIHVQNTRAFNRTLYKIHRICALLCRTKPSSHSYIDTWELQLLLLLAMEVFSCWQWKRSAAVWVCADRASGWSHHYVCIILNGRSIWVFFTSQAKRSL